ncbi:MAG: hypothetical protein ACOYU3_07015 [Bacillota bacterium]
MKKIAFGTVLVFLLALGAVTVHAAPQSVSDWGALRQAVASAASGDCIVLAGDLEADGEIVIGKDITISGDGHSVRPQSGYQGRALVLKNAAVTIENTRFGGFSCKDGDGAAGGVLFAQNCSLKLLRCVFTDNSADNSGGVLYHSKGTLHITHCTFNSNKACTSGGTSGFGGAVFNDGTDMNVQNSVFTANSAGRYGGVVYATFNSQEQNNKVEFAGCTFEQNTANGGGGAVYALSGLQPLTVDACTFTQNSVTGAGAGGGAIAVRAPHTYISGSAFSENTSDGEGPALKMLSGDLYLDTVSFDHNTRGSTYEYGEDIALSYGYGVNRLALTVDGKPCEKSINIGDKAELFIGCDAKEAPFVIESSDASVVALQNVGQAYSVDGGYAAALTGESSGKAKITLREDRGKTYAVLDVSVSTVSSRCRITGISFKGIKDPLPVEVQGQAWTVEVPAKTDVTCLVPTIAFEGVSTSPRDGVPTDFSSPVTYTVTAQSGKKLAYQIAVHVKATALDITGLPENLIVYAGGKYTLKASIPGGQWSYYAPAATAETDGDILTLEPCNAGGGWVEYEVMTGDGMKNLRREFTVIPALLPVAGQSLDGIALLIVFAALCILALKLLPKVPES